MNFTMIDRNEIFEQGFTAKGTRLLTADELLASLDYLIENGAYPHTIEAYEFFDGNERLILAFSLLGLDNDDFNDPDGEKIIELVRNKALLAKQHAHVVKFQMWLDEIADK